MSEDGGGPRLTLVASPIGNLGDLSPRAAQELADADIWFVEDTRVSARLGVHLGVKKPMRVLNDHTSPAQVERYAADVKAGLRAVVLTDGGAPVVSDPGALLGDACHEIGVPVLSVPGPSAVTNALALSGFFGQRFAFLGFLGRKPGAIRGELEPFAESPLTLVLFESPHRIDSLLKVTHEALGERRYALCREMTKTFEQTYRSRLPEVPDEGIVPRKGEFTVVVEGRRRRE